MYTHRKKDLENLTGCGYVPFVPLLLGGGVGLQAIGQEGKESTAKCI